jgi:sugar lactone lactonase YvrE
MAGAFAVPVALLCAWIAASAAPPTAGTLFTIAGSTAPGGGANPSNDARTIGLQPAGVAAVFANNEIEAIVSDRASQVIRVIAPSVPPGSTNKQQVIAGSASSGRRGDAGPSTLAQMISPAGIAFAGGETYFSDVSTHTVHRVTATGSLIAVAGSGDAGFAGDGGPATAAALNGPYAIALDSGGALFIADTRNNRVRRVDATTHTIATYAGDGVAGATGDGGPATDASLNAPAGLAVDSVGNLFIADNNNNRIRRVDAVSHQLSSYASVTDPRGLALDLTGNLLVASRSDCRVYRVDVVTQAVSTVVGTATCGFSGDGGLASAATLREPEAVAVAPDGEIIVADTGNNRVRRIWTDGKIDTIAGIGKAGSSGDVPFLGQPADGPSTDRSALDGQMLFPSAAAPWTFPFAASTASVVVVTDTGNDRIRVVGTDPCPNDPFSGACTADDFRLATIAGGGLGGLGDGGRATQATLNSPRGVAVESSGRFIYIADTFNNRIRVVEMRNNVGYIATLAGTGTAGYSEGTATSAMLNHPFGVAVDSLRGLVYVADTFNHRVRRINITTNAITTIVGTGSAGFSPDGADGAATSLNTPMGIAVDGDGHLYIADTYNQRVLRWDMTTHVVRRVAGVAPTGPAASYVPQPGFSGDGGPAAAAALAFPYGVAASGTGAAGVEVLIADTGNNRIRRVAPNSQISTIAGSGVGAFENDGLNCCVATVNGPRGVAASFGGDALISDSLNHRLRVVHANRPPVAALSANHTSGPNPLHVDFDESGSSSLDDTATYVLDFGDGTSVTTTSPPTTATPHTYITAGTFTATLTVTDAHGASSTASVTITVS